MESDAIGLTAIIGTIGAIITALIKLFDAMKSWKETRDDDRRIKKEIDHTLKEIQFINNWLEATQKAANDQAFLQRQDMALGRLDQLMHSYKTYCQEEKLPIEAAAPKKNNKWFYAMSTFLVLMVMGMFIDDDGEWSLSYFQHEFDSDAITGLIFFLIIWVYFYINSAFFKSSRSS